jgi:hypothetical protein
LGFELAGVVHGLRVVMDGTRPATTTGRSPCSTREIAARLVPAPVRCRGRQPFLQRGVISGRTAATQVVDAGGVVGGKWRMGRTRLFMDLWCLWALAHVRRALIAIYLIANRKFTLACLAMVPTAL